METHLLERVTPETAGAPMGERKGVRRSVRKRRQRLAHMGHGVSAPTVRRLLKKHDYVLRVNAKAQAAGSRHPDRNAPFPYIAAQKQGFAAAGWPIIRVDTKQKELIGDVKKAGQVWCRYPIEGTVHDFPGDALGRAVPYGIYDLQRHHGAV